MFSRTLNWSKHLFYNSVKKLKSSVKSAGLYAWRGAERIADAAAYCILFGSFKIIDFVYDAGVWLFKRKATENMVPGAIKSRRSNVNNLQPNGKTQLHLACVEGNFERVKELISQGADVNLSDENGQTPLFGAAAQKHTQIVSFLLQNGANPLIKDKNYTLASVSWFQFLRSLFSTPMRREARNRFLAIDYVHGLKFMSKMIILGKEVKQQPHKIGLMKDTRVFYNFDGYLPSLRSNYEKNIRINPLKYTVSGTEYPVGFKIFVPPGLTKVNKVCVDVYGGSTAAGLNSISPFGATNQGCALLKEDCVWISIALPDYLQDKFQFYMTPEFQNIIHAGINAFYKAIKKTPETLSPELKNLSFHKADYYLMGASFGGRTTVRHAQLYPNTFNGYISLNGALAQNSDLPIIGSSRVFTHPESILPYYHVKDLYQPVLLLQNMDDNNVHPMTAAKFNQAVVDAGKEKLFKIVLFEKGSPTTKYGKYNKGHFQSNEDIEKSTQAIIGFMQNNRVSSPSLQRTRVGKTALNSVIYFRDYAKKEDHVLITLHQKLYASTRHRFMLKNHPNQWNRIWKNAYLPLIRRGIEAYEMANDPNYCQQYIQKLIEQKKITQQTIKRAIKYHAKKYREYHLELNSSKKLDEQDIIDNPCIQKAYCDQLLRLDNNAPFELRHFILESFFEANPTLLPSLSESKTLNQENLDRLSAKLKERLEVSIELRHNDVKKTWRETIKSVIMLRNYQQFTADNKLTESQLSDPNVIYNRLFLTHLNLIGNDKQAAVKEQKMRQEVIKSLRLQSKKLINKLKTQRLSATDKRLLRMVKQINTLGVGYKPIQLQHLKQIQRVVWRNSSFRHQDIRQLLFYRLMLNKAMQKESCRSLEYELLQDNILQAYLSDHSTQARAFDKTKAHIKQYHPNYTKVISVTRKHIAFENPSPAAPANRAI